MVPAAAVEFADAFGGFLDALNEKLDGFFSTLHASDVSGAPRSVGPGGVVRLQNWSSLPLDGFKAMSAASRHFYIKLLQLVLKQPVAWFTGSAFRSLAEVKESMEALDMPGGRVACVLFWSRFPRFFQTTECKECRPKSLPVSLCCCVVYAAPCKVTWKL